MARVCAAVGLSLYLSGCGGGGDDTASTSTTKNKTTLSSTWATTMSSTRATTTDGPGGGGSLTGLSNLGFNVMSGSYAEGTEESSSLPPPYERTSSSTSSYIAFSSDEALYDLSKSFGVDVSGQKGAFSGSAQYQNMRQSVTSSKTVTVQGELFAPVIHKISVVTPETMLSIHKTASLETDIGNLPTTAASGSMSLWVAFFNTYGTHFLSKSHFGGKMHLKFNSAVEKSSLTSSFENSFKLGAQGSFQDMTGLPLGVSGSATCTDEDKRTFATASSYSSQDLQTEGGDPTKTSWPDWKDTVRQHMVPVRQEYASMDQLVQTVGSRKGWSLTEVEQRREAMKNALAQYLQLCPSGCNGNGLCDISKHTCSCDQGFSGASCSKMLCPKACGEGGSCDTSVGECSCQHGWNHQDPTDKTSPCSIDCRMKHYVGDFECDGQHLLRNPIYGTIGYGSAINTCANECDASRWGCQCGMLVAKMVCANLMCDTNSIASSFEIGDPNCDWGFLSACTFFEPWTIGDGWDSGIGGCSETGWEPAHPDVFASITCKPVTGCDGYTDGFTDGLPVVVVLHSNASARPMKKHKNQTGTAV